MYRDQEEDLDQYLFKAKTRQGSFAFLTRRGSLKIKGVTVILGDTATLPYYDLDLDLICTREEGDENDE